MFLVDNDDEDDFVPQSSISAFPQSYTMQQPHWNKLGLNELKNEDIAKSFRDYQPPPKHDSNQFFVSDTNHNRNIDHNINQYKHEMDADDINQDIDNQHQTMYDDIIDDHHDEVPYDTIIFHQNLMTQSTEIERKMTDNIKQEQEEIQETKYYENSTILKRPNPMTCFMDLTKQFEEAFQTELEIVLKQSAKDKFKQYRESIDNDFQFGRANMGLSTFEQEEKRRKSNWECYDLGWKNKLLFSPSINNGKLFTCMNKQYFQQDKVAEFHQIKELNTIKTHSIISGLEKILGQQIYLEFINKLLKVHKKYYFDKKDEWNNLSNGDKLQELCDSYCGEIKNMLSFVSIRTHQMNNLTEKKHKLGSKILTKFYDALQLILALYAPRCGSGPQSNIKIPEKQIKGIQFNHNMNMNQDHDDLFDVDDELNDDDDYKMNLNKDKKQKKNPKISYNELFARRYNLSKWLQGVIRNEIDDELKKYDQEIIKVNAGLFEINENEDEKNENEEKNISSNKLEKMNDRQKKAEIDRWIDEKIFTLLTANRKLEAAELAIQNGDFRLSTLIAQSPHFAATDNKYQPFVDIRNQIDYWQKHKIWKTFNVAKRKIYALLAGRYVETVSSHKFNWFRCFGILIWYYLPINWLLTECILNYDDHTDIKQHPFIKPHLTLAQDIKEMNKIQQNIKQEMLNNNPLPLLPSMLFTKNQLNNKFPNDICYDLLRMKCSMIDPFKYLFNPRNIQPFQLEYLFNFFIHDLLFVSGIIDIEQNISSNIYHSFIEQLERMGYWHWAIYLSLFIAKQNNLGLNCNYNHVILLILQRNINKPIPRGFNTKIIQQTRLNELSFADLRPRPRSMEIDDDNDNDNDNDDDDDDDDDNDQKLPDHYIYCDKSEQFGKEYLNKHWKSILDETTIDGLKFLVHIGIDQGLIVFCLAQYAESIQDWPNAFRSYLKCSKWNKVHQILIDYLFFDWMMKDKIDKLENSLNILQKHNEEIMDWNQNGMIIYQYIKLMRSIRNNPDKNIEININRIQLIKQGINKMLDALNDNNDDDQSECGPDLEKKVCLMTMEQRLDTCLVHLIQNK